MMIAALLIFASLQCYNLLKKYDILTSQNVNKTRLCSSHVAVIVENINLKITDENYRKQNNVGGKIKAILATKDVSLFPEIGISKKVSFKDYYKMRF